MIGSVVSALLKVEILKANHNQMKSELGGVTVVSALLKVEILKANHNALQYVTSISFVVSALLKVEILKANHNPGKKNTSDCHNLTFKECIFVGEQFTPPFYACRRTEF